MPRVVEEKWFEEIGGGAEFSEGKKTADENGKNVAGIYMYTSMYTYFAN